MSNPDGIDQALQQAKYLMWVRELNAVDEKGRPDWHKRRSAATEILEMLGAKDLIRAVAGDALRPAPAWPEVDVVPVGGGPGVITCEVRTWTRERGKLKVKIALLRPGRRARFNSEQIRTALDRGKFELKKIIEKH